jgi:hypothetical protein
MWPRRIAFRWFVVGAAVAACAGFVAAGGEILVLPIVALAGLLIGWVHWRGFEIGRRWGRRDDG